MGVGGDAVEAEVGGAAARGDGGGLAWGGGRRRKPERVALGDEHLEPRLGQCKGIQRRFVVGVYAALARQRGKARGEEVRQHDQHEQRHREREAAPATGRFDHLSWVLKDTAVTPSAWRGTGAPSGARSLWLVRPSSNPRVSLNGVGGPAWAVSLPATKKRNFAVGSNGATSSSACPVAKMVRHSAVRPGSATDGLNSYVNR